ncbi:hypothetical protein BSL78_09221 [Apostichopus japonicus]|uniref:LRRCT domain-containing protein n=1 Tax=Stichopus japonicus TaxID=307972 RepID=A0A2G8L0V4_STIJA|nr:hypothetical protein BSL78_09221 [Apostichopus japonicus]
MQKDTFQSLRHLRFLQLQGNNLGNIEDGIFSPLLNNWVILLNNPWRCDDRICGLRTWLTKHPSFVRGPLFDTLSEDFHGNFLYLNLDDVKCETGSRSSYIGQPIEHLPDGVCLPVHSQSSELTTTPPDPKKDTYVLFLWSGLALGACIVFVVLMVACICIVGRRRRSKRRPNDDLPPPNYDDIAASGDLGRRVGSEDFHLATVKLPPEHLGHYDRKISPDEDPYLSPKYDGMNDYTDPQYLSLE